MPRGILYACHAPNCGELVRGSRYCERHALERAARERARKNARPAFRARGYDAAWDNLSREARRRQPWCVRCGAPGALADHIVPRAEGGPNDLGNVQVLCRSCHGLKTAAERRRRRW